MTTTAILQAIWPGLRRVLLRIGRWLLRTIADEGLRWLISYMRQRVRVFQARLKRVLARRHSKWRPKWLRGRIRRWRNAISWLKSKRAAKLKGRVLDAAQRMAERTIPEEAPDESFSRWRRRQAA
jgi:hypothetical protein